MTTTEDQDRLLQLLKNEDKIGRKRYKRPSKFKTCKHCGEPFEYENKTQLFCSKPKCRKALKKRDDKRKLEQNRERAEAKTRLDFSKGEVFVLDMSKPMEEWEWTLEVRG